MSNWYSTILIFAIIFAILGFIGLGDGEIAIFQILFYFLIFGFVTMIIAQTSKNRI